MIKDIVFKGYIILWLIGFGMIMAKFGQEKESKKYGWTDIIETIINLLLLLAIYGVFG